MTPAIIIILQISLILNVVSLILYWKSTKYIAYLNKVMFDYQACVNKLIEENKKSTVDNYVKAILKIMDEKRITKKEETI